MWTQAQETASMGQKKNKKKKQRKYLKADDEDQKCM